MKTYTDARILREDLAKGHVPSTVVIEVQSDLVASLLGQRFTGPDGHVASMEQVSIAYDPYLERAVASPVFINVSEVQSHGSLFTDPALD